MIFEWSSEAGTAPPQGDVRCLIISEAQAQGEGLAADWAARVRLLSAAGLFSGKQGQVYVLPVMDPPEQPVVILAGCGKGQMGMPELRQLMAQTARAAYRLKAATLVVQIPAALGGPAGALMAEQAGQAIAEGLVLGSYRRRQYKLEQAFYAGLDTVQLRMERKSEAAEEEAWRQGIKRGQALGRLPTLPVI